MEMADEVVSVPLPDEEQCGHADSSEVFFAVRAEILKENIAEGDGSHASIVLNAHGFFHTRLVNGIHALRRNADLVQRQIDGLRLLYEEFAADAMHADAIVGFRDGR